MIQGFYTQVYTKGIYFGVCVCVCVCVYKAWPQTLVDPVPRGIIHNNKKVETTQNSVNTWMD